jgi:hypothetical protein
MQNDERDDRAEGWDRDPGEPQAEPGAAADSEPARPADATSEPEGPAGSPDEEPRRPDEEDEFETAAWPQRDLSADASEPAPAPPAQAEPAAEPPPSEVEAYAPAVPAEPPQATVPAHSVPATEPGESTRCPRCGTENRPGISFCRNCGQRLVAAGAPTTVARPAAPEGTRACPRCGTHNRAGVAFCQNCGANLRAAEGYVPPEAAPAAPPAVRVSVESGGPALLGPSVLLIGAIGIVTAWLLPFATGSGSLFDQAFGRADGYGIGFWSAYGAISTMAAKLYFGLAAPAPLMVLLLVALAVGGFLRPAPGTLQMIGLVVALLWSIAMVVLFLVVEVFGASGTDLLAILRGMSPGGIIFLLASLIVVIGVLTRIGRS